MAELHAARARLAVPAGHLPYLGSHLALTPEAGRLRAHRRGDALLVPGDEPRAAIERWYRRTARAEIAPRLDDAVAALGRGVHEVTIREQRTRWASCSTSGAMSFNWRLLLGPKRCSTTSSGTRRATSWSWTIRGGSGRCRAHVPATARRTAGCAHNGSALVLPD